MLVGTVFLLIATMLFQVCPMALVSLFGAETELYNEFAVKCLRIYLMLCLVNGFQTCTSIFFQSVGKPIQASVNTFVKQILLVPLGMVVFSQIIGVTGSLWAGPFADGTAFFLAMILLKMNWKNIFPVKNEV